MPDPGAKSGAVSFVTQSAGLDNYVVFKPEAGQLRLDQAFTDGVVIKYMVTNGADISIEKGAVSLPDTLTRTEFIISNTGSPISWPTTGQRTVWPLVEDLPLCDTPPEDGQVLIWDADANDGEGAWCPGDITTTPTGADCGVDMQNVDSGTAYSVAITKCETQVIWNSPDPGEKDTTIEAVGADQDGYQLNIKANTGDGSVHCVRATGATIGSRGDDSVEFTDNFCDLALVYNHAKTDWLIRCLCCYTPMPCEEEPPAPGPRAAFVPSSIDPAIESHLTASGPLDTGAALGDGEGTLSLWYLVQPYTNTGSILEVRRDARYWDLSIDFTPFNDTLRFAIDVDSFGVSLPRYMFNHVGFMPPTPFGLWTNLLISWKVDLGAGSRIIQVRTNDVEYGSRFIVNDTGAAFLVNYRTAVDVTEFDITHNPGAGNINTWAGGVYDYWFHPVYFDLDVEANRRKFILPPGDTSFYVAPDLGANGQIPLGFAPAIFQHMDPVSGVPSDFYINRGTGGGFSLVDTDFTTVPSSPELS